MKTLKEWCYETKNEEILSLYENAKNEKKSDEIGFSSGKDVWWYCDKCKIKWQQKPNKFTKRINKGCPYCNYERPSYLYNFAILYPELANEWDNEKNEKKPSDYLPGSSARVYWKCKNNHCFDERITDRIDSYKKSKKLKRELCPYCNHERVSPNYNLLTEFPRIAKQWNYILNGSLTPLLVSPKSNKKVWWICEFNPNHIWQDRIGNRTMLNRNCPKCKDDHVSLIAKILFYYLSKYFIDCKIEWPIIGRYKADLYLPSCNYIIEYDGWYYHESEESKKREKRKDNCLKKNGFKILRIKESKQKIENIEIKEDYILYYKGNDLSNIDELINAVFLVIGEKINHKFFIKTDVLKDYQKIEDLYYHIRKSNSIAVKHIKLMQEWSPNNIINPDCVNERSNEEVKWICPKCNNEYETEIRNRAVLGTNCPFCANIKVYEKNSLAYLYPEIAKEWDYEKNKDLTPDLVPPGCDKKVWWKCNNGHSWKTNIYTRTGKSKTKCPYCSKQKNNILSIDN